MTHEQKKGPFGTNNGVNREHRGVNILQQGLALSLRVDLTHVPG